MEINISRDKQSKISRGELFSWDKNEKTLIKFTIIQAADFLITL